MLKKVMIVLVLLLVLAPLTTEAAWFRCGYLEDGREYAYDGDTIHHMVNSNNVAVTTGKWRLMDMNTKTGYVYQVVLRDYDMAFKNTYFWRFDDGQYITEGELNEPLYEGPSRNSNYGRLFRAMILYRPGAL